MRLVVDMTKCQSYAQCCFLAPESFSFQGQEALMYDPAPDDGDRLKVLQAAAACPVQAILVDRADDIVEPPAIPDPLPGARPPAVGPDDHVVVVGASLAGLRGAEAIRREGFTGRLTVIGEEPDEPYDRPPLSKQVLLGAAETTTLPRRTAIDATFELGVAATGLDPDARAVRLADGRTITYDRVLIATGTRSREWPREAGGGLAGVHTVRTIGDARALRAELTARPGRVLVVGGGFTGNEVASVCRDLDLPVTLAVRGAAPLVGAFGGVIGRVAADVARDAGVDLCCDVSVTGLEGDTDGHVRRARLSDGGVVEADVVVVATGAVRNAEWLEGSGLSAGAWGVTSDAGCRVFDLNGVVTDDVFVAGDVARFPHPLFGSEFLAMEHWGNAVEQAEVAAHNMVTGDARRRAHLSVPVFWSIQFHHVVKSVGVPAVADEVMIVQGSPAERSFVAIYGRAGRLVGAVAYDQGKWLEHYRREIAAGGVFPPPDATLDPTPGRAPVPAEMPTPRSPWGRATEADIVVTGHDAGDLQAVRRTPGVTRASSPIREETRA